MLLLFKLITKQRHDA